MTPTGRNLGTKARVARVRKGKEQRKGRKGERKGRRQGEEQGEEQGQEEDQREGKGVGILKRILPPQNQNIQRYCLTSCCLNDLISFHC